MKLEIYRTDINKTVVPAMEYADADSAVGKYCSALMLVGILGMNNKPIRYPEGNCYTLANGWTLQVRVA